MFRFACLIDFAPKVAPGEPVMQNLTILASLALTIAFGLMPALADQRVAQVMGNATLKKVQTEVLKKPQAAQFVPPPERFVFFQTVCPAGSPNAEYVTYATFLLFGSIATSPAGLAGSAPEMSVIVFEPFVVAKTFPFVSPTMRTLSSCGETAIDAIRRPETSGPWLTTDIFRPLFEER